MGKVIDFKEYNKKKHKELSKEFRALSDDLVTPVPEVDKK